MTLDELETLICSAGLKKWGYFPDELKPYTVHSVGIYYGATNCKIAIFNSVNTEIVAYTDDLDLIDDEIRIKTYLNDLAESIKKLKNKLLLDEIKTDF